MNYEKGYCKVCYYGIKYSILECPLHNICYLNPKKYLPEYKNIKKWYKNDRRKKENV